MNHKFSAQKLNKMRVSQGFSDEPVNSFGILITKPSEDSDQISTVLSILNALDTTKGEESLM